jgi:3',5'-cyclic-AMP phosphodiesterase
MIKIIQISDFHLLQNKLAKFIGIKPFVHLEKIISVIKNDITKYQPDFIALTGDLSQDYSARSYELVKEAFKDISIPIYTIFGNHDEPQLFQNICPEFTAKNLEFNKWQIIFLNSHWKNHTEGLLDDTELTKLKTTLAQNNKKHILIFLHHHVLPINSPWLDKLSLKNSNEFLALCDKYKNIKILISGHVHQESLQRRNGVDYITSPATSVQFQRNSKTFALEPLMPGFRYIELHDDGTYKTAVIRLPYDQIYIPDLTSKGY